MGIEFLSECATPLAFAFAFFNAKLARCAALNWVLLKFSSCALGGRSQESDMCDATI